MREAWCLSHGVKASYIGSNLFLFQFKNMAEKRRVISSGPWAFDRQLFVITDYTGDVPPLKVNFDSCAFWIRIFNLPLTRMNYITGEFIGNKMGQFIALDSGESDMSWGKFLRIRVELNIHLPLRRAMKLFMDGKVWQVHFQYERLPTFCYWCGIIGHREKECKERPVNGGESQYGPWLRVNTTSQKKDSGTKNKLREEKRRCSLEKANGRGGSECSSSGRSSSKWRRENFKPTHGNVLGSRTPKFR